MGEFTTPTPGPVTHPTLVFEEYDLPNGLHVILCPSHSVPLVSLNLWYHVGSKDEDPKRTGFAHLFEHMMFQGSKHVKKAEHFRYVQNVGGTLNATTNQDRTNYFEILPSSELELAMWLESDRMMALEVTEENFENQRAVVKEERRQRYDNQPYGTVYENLLLRVFPTSGYHWSTIGSMQHLDETEIHEVQAFHKQFYHPNNASLCLVGDFKRDEAMRLIDRYFGVIPAGPAIARHPQVIEPIGKQVRHVMYDNVQLPAVYVAFQSAHAYSEDEYKLDIVSDVLSKGRSSRLYRELVYKQRIAKEVNCYNLSNEKAGMFMLSGIAQIGIDIERVEEALWMELAKMRADLADAQELQKVKNKFEAGYVRSLTEVGSRADHLQRAWTFKRNASLANGELQKLLDVTAEQAREAAIRYLTPEKAVVIHVLPKAMEPSSTDKS
ncbi:MAG TPA: pitrilysin family protein [Candidatus Kapabacteria bacterium]|nr:pitrilysin family protein [Candidatus Kapabacteria bacterium]